MGSAESGRGGVLFVWVRSSERTDRPARQRETCKDRREWEWGVERTNFKRFHIPPYSAREEKETPPDGQKRRRKDKTVHTVVGRVVTDGGSAVSDRVVRNQMRAVCNQHTNTQRAIERTIQRATEYLLLRLEFVSPGRIARSYRPVVSPGRIAPVVSVGVGCCSVYCRVTSGMLGLASPSTGICCICCG